MSCLVYDQKYSNNVGYAKMLFTQELTPKSKFDLESIMLEDITIALKTVGQTPEWFDVQATCKYWKNSFDKFMEEASLSYKFKKIESPDSISDDERNELIVEATKSLKEYLIKIYPRWQEASMGEFLNSDLPLELYVDYGLSYINNIIALGTMELIMRKCIGKMHANSSNEKRFERVQDNYERQMDDLDKYLLPLYRSESAMRMFLTCINGTKIEDLFESVPLNVDKHEKEFNKHLDTFKNSIVESTRYLNGNNPLLCESYNNNLQNFKKDIGVLF